MKQFVASRNTAEHTESLVHKRTIHFPTASINFSFYKDFIQVLSFISEHNFPSCSVLNLRLLACILYTRVPYSTNVNPHMNTLCFCFFMGLCPATDSDPTAVLKRWFNPALLSFFFFCNRSNFYVNLRKSPDKNWRYVQ